MKSMTITILKLTIARKTKQKKQNENQIAHRFNNVKKTYFQPLLY